MVSKPGYRRIRDRELETLRDICELAAFIATETFDAEIASKVVLEIDSDGTERFDLRNWTEEMEVPTS